MITENGKTLHLKRAFNVDIATLYRAWSEPKNLTLWWKDLTLAEVDFRIGGAFKFIWTDGPENAAYGTYIDIEPSAKIAFSWSWKDEQGHSFNTLVTLKFASLDAKRSQLELIHELSPTEETRAGHHKGWTSALDFLDRHLNAKSRPIIAGLEARVSRTLKFPVSRVFEAWTNPEIISLWFNIRQATRGQAVGPVKVGSTLSMDCENEKGELCRVYCEYKEIVPNTKISFMWLSDPAPTSDLFHRQAESRVTVLFTALGNSTKVEVIHDQLTSESAMNDYFEGWTDCLASIEDRLSRLERNVASLKFSPHLDVRVSDPKAAAEFYVKYLGWSRVASDCHEEAFKFGPLTIYLGQAKEASPSSSNVHFEASTKQDIEGLKKTLEDAGCKSEPSSMKNAFMFHDPFGNNFHIYQA